MCVTCGLIKKKLLISAKPYRLFGTTLFGIWNLSYPNSSSRRNWNTKQKHLQSPIFKRRLTNRRTWTTTLCTKFESESISPHGDESCRFFSFKVWQKEKKIHPRLFGNQFLNIGDCKCFCFNDSFSARRVWIWSVSYS